MRVNVDDYKKYETDLQRRLTLPKYFLSRWAYFEMNATSLKRVELKQAKTLYQTLGHLTKEERTFLANKYRADFEKKHENSKNYKLDRVASKEHGMTMREYVKLRTGIELKFFHYLQNYVDKRTIY